jgi:hypothetical protein
MSEARRMPQLISPWAIKHGIGANDLSDNGDVCFPTAKGGGLKLPITC